jgi:hypothetical protein
MIMHFFGVHMYCKLCCFFWYCIAIPCCLWKWRWALQTWHTFYSQVFRNLVNNFIKTNCSKRVSWRDVLLGQFSWSSQTFQMFKLVTKNVFKRSQLEGLSAIVFICKITFMLVIWGHRFKICFCYFKASLNSNFFGRRLLDGGCQHCIR